MADARGQIGQFFGWTWRNVDAVLAVIAGLVVGVLGLLNVSNVEVVGAATLFLLAVLAQVNLRDRWRRRAFERSSTEVLQRTTDVIADLRPQLRALEQTVVMMRDQLAVMSSVRVLDAADVGEALADARKNTEVWMFKGGTGTFLRAVTLRECVDGARAKRRNLQVRLEIIDPTNEAMCDRYARFRRSLSDRPDGTGQVWTPERTRKEAYATILAAAWHAQRYNLLDIEVALSAVMTTFRWDLSSSCVIITQEDPRGSAMLVERDQFYYGRWKAELSESFRQARPVPLARASHGMLRDEPTVDEVRRLFQAIELPLPRSLGDRDVTEIVGKAIHARNPYEP